MTKYIPTEVSEESLLMQGRNFETRDGVTYAEVEEAELKKETYFKKLFGTPEKAAETIISISRNPCRFCAVNDSLLCPGHCDIHITSKLNQEAKNA